MSEGVDRPRIPKEKPVFKTVEVQGCPWRYLEYGNPQGQPILNIHGWLGSTAEGEDKLSRAFTGESQNSEGLRLLSTHDQKAAEALATRVKGLANKYHVITPALPGFGTTEPLPVNPTLDALADSLFAFQQATHTEGAVIFGVSMGGIIATKLAARHPESTNMLVLQGTMTRPEDFNSMYYIAARIAGIPKVSKLLENAEWPWAVSRWLFKKLDKDYRLTDPEDQERLVNTVARGDKKTAVATFKEIGNEIQGDIDRVTCPVVVLDGAHAEMVPIMKSHDVTKRFPTRTVFLPIGGHAGKLGHALINRFPEGVAAWVDHVFTKVTSRQE